MGRWTKRRNKEPEEELTNLSPDNPRRKFGGYMRWREMMDKLELWPEPRKEFLERELEK